MTEFVLIRHGETEWNASGRLQGSTDTPLSPLGISQARAAASVLASDSWDVVISSPLQRAFETAVQIVDPLGIDASEIIVDPRVSERRYGAAEGLTIAERDERFPDGKWPDSETRDLLEVRVSEALQDFASIYQGKRIVIVSHGGWIRAAIRVMSNHDKAASGVTIPNASCTYASFDNGEWTLGELAAISHLPLFE